MTYPNWFASTGALDNFTRHLKSFENKEVNFLQIGAFTGDASKWMLDEVLTHPKSRLIDVDTWKGSDENSHDEMDFEDVYKTYLDKVGEYKNLTHHRMTSDEFFASNTLKFDFIYIDGDHRAFSVMKDLINAYEALELFGFLGCDDYQWSEGRGSFYDPRPAIDAFFNMTRGKVKVVEVGWQVWFQKAPWS
jgi:hypothetical protein